MCLYGRFFFSFFFRKLYGKIGLVQISGCVVPSLSYARNSTVSRTRGVTENDKSSRKKKGYVKIRVKERINWGDSTANSFPHGVERVERAAPPSSAFFQRVSNLCPAYNRYVSASGGGGHRRRRRRRSIARKRTPFLQQSPSFARGEAKEKEE